MPARCIFQSWQHILTGPDTQDLKREGLLHRWPEHMQGSVYTGPCSDFLLHSLHFVFFVLFSLNIFQTVRLTLRVCIEMIKFLFYLL